MKEKECLKIGGHCWNHHSANDVVDMFGRSLGMSNLVYYPTGEPQYRTCRHCGKRQLQKEKWEDSK